ncbi:tryptophan--tRNA ligase [Enterobacteriaceae endosymbiont of Plateumaris consimilis]|uniref:tryptophan--tRNA ligase n=1 Tax=Enterobacteriaceae endosymbiont of Plateumaris consimilis TaxID=2675794 RepID=UPI001449F72D|nr:tryptophan--tRNA ligase [Enterobacteriaceae endosymbiont of Plateumaris consimilis]QJC28748.1 tryptophan--tRNA ligase [Enterobacteriaceae endosymbiont of Plateumaris consimilis]
MLIKKTVFSAIQPTGNITIGNYIGALQQWNQIQKKYFCIYCIADLHSLTIYQKPNILNKNILDTLAIFLACDIDPNKNIIFIQSHVPQHTQLSWILNCFTYFGELKRMIQFKEKILFLKKNNNINIGLFNYPILMAADILLYQTNKVPVGKDQIQHIEIARKIAIRFNSIYGKNIFTIPEKIINPNKGSCIMSLLNPFKKMSKSDSNSNNIINLFDNNDMITKKINNAVTDSDIPPRIIYDKINKPGISNLLSILSNITNNSIKNLEREFKGKIYNDLKKSVIKNLCIFLHTFQKKYYKYRENKKLLNNIIVNGSNQAQKLAKITLNNINNLIGLYNK